MQTMTRRTAEAISLLQKLGDYLRAGTYPRPQSPGWQKLEEMELEMSDISDVRAEIRNSIDRHIRCIKATGEALPLPLLQNVLPEFCRLHSVTHGMEIWFHHHQQLHTEACRAHIGFCIAASSESLIFLANRGLTLPMAKEVLILAGRHVVDPTYGCFSVFPSEDAAHSATAPCCSHPSPILPAPTH